MKFLLTVGVGLLALVFILATVAFFLPRRYLVQRSIHIQATAETVYASAADLRQWKEWGVWFDRDPKMNLEYSMKTDIVGGWSAWETQGHRRKMTLAKLQPPSRVGYRLEFSDKEIISMGLVEIVPSTAGVNVTLSNEGDLGINPVNRWVGLFLDRTIGPDFDAGLTKLKQVCERGHPKATPIM